MAARRELMLLPMVWKDLVSLDGMLLSVVVENGVVVKI